MLRLRCVLMSPFWIDKNLVSHHKPIRGQSLWTAALSPKLVTVCCFTSRHTAGLLGGDFLPATFSLSEASTNYQSSLLIKPCTLPSPVTTITSIGPCDESAVPCRER